MHRLLIIEDEKLYQRMIERALKDMDVELAFADDGDKGLQAAYDNPPDMIICDVMMPTISGYDVTRRLRRDPRFVNVPILILTAQVDLTNKLEAFEAGADDHMGKPFEPAELVARVTVLLRRSDVTRTAAEQTAALALREFKSQVIAVHSLRGGVGCSSLAVNMAIALQRLWNAPTLALDMVLTAGQVALMLDASLKRTWSDITHVKANELDVDVLDSIIGHHDSGINFITSPTYPTEAELLTLPLFKAAFVLLQGKFEYIVVDLPHDFSPLTLEVLDRADVIVEVLAPELASVRAAVAALDTYNRLEYSSTKIEFLLNYPFKGHWLQRKKIEAALRRPVEVVLPYTPDTFVDAINIGQPVLFGRPNDPISEVISYVSGQVSKVEHVKGISPTVEKSWNNVAKKMKDTA